VDGVNVVRIVSGPLSGVSLHVTDRSLSERWRLGWRSRRRRRRTSEIITTIVPAEHPETARSQG
jgi:hypothetical protein